MHVHIITYGCSNNQAESQIMEALLLKKGEKIVDSVKDADAIVVNTCSVKSATEQKILHNISSLHEKNPEKHIVIAGCMPEAEYKKVKEMAPFASLLSTGHIDKIDEAVHRKVDYIGKTRLEKAGMPRVSRYYPVIVPIASGCLSACTFCSTKIAKGALVSYKPENIIREIETGKENGQKEFWLTSQDCGCYGFDIRTDMAELLNRITSQIRGQYFLRVGMMNPEHTIKILPELIESYRNEHVFKFLHLPVQSGSQKILDSMKRNHNLEDFRRIVEEFRAAMPEITIWTDMIVGFPGETEEDFEESMELIRSVRPDFTNVSAYSVRPNTRAAGMKQVHTEIKKERTRRMGELVKHVSEERNKKWVGWKGLVIVDEYNEEKSNFVGRNYAYKPMILKGAYKMGQTLDAEVNGALHSALIGKSF